MGRLPIKAWASAAIVTTALPSTPAYAADGGGVCGTIRLAETAVAMLDNQPIVKVFANSATVLLLLDIRAEATVLTPAAAQRIGAQQVRVKLGRQMHGITGDIPAGELELRSFTIGGVEVPRTTQRNAAITDWPAIGGLRSRAQPSGPGEWPVSAVCLSDPVLSARAQNISRRAYWSHAGLNKARPATRCAARCSSITRARSVTVPISKQDIQIIR